MPFEGAEYVDQVDELNARLRDAHPSEVLRVAYETYGDKLAMVSSFGAESAVLLHLVSRVNPNIPVLFLDTGMLFGQTLDYRQQLAARLGLTEVRDLRPQYHDLATGDPQAKHDELAVLEAEGRIARRAEREQFRGPVMDPGHGLGQERAAGFLRRRRESGVGHEALNLLL